MQRKGRKTSVIFDIGLTLAFSGTTSDDNDISGEIVVSDFDHDTKEDGYEVRASRDITTGRR